MKADQNGVPPGPDGGDFASHLARRQPGLILNNETLCTDRNAGANCSNRGCDLAIMARQSSAWKQIVNEHLTRNVLSVSDNGELN